MDYSVTFARHFSRLVWLLLHETDNIDEQKAALRAVVTVAKDGPVVLATEDWRLVVNGSALPEALTGVQDLAAQLIGHAVKELHADQGAAPADLLGIARILAAEPVPGDGGAAVEQKLAALASQTVRVTVQGREVVSRPSGSMTAVPGPKRDDAPAPRQAEAPAPREQAPAREEHEPALEERTGSPAPASAPAAPMAGLVHEDHYGQYLDFAATQVPTGAVPEHFAQLDGTKSVNITTRLLDELVTLAENAAREGKADVVAEIFHGIVLREGAPVEPEVRRAYAMAMRRMSKPTLLRAVATLLPRRRERIDNYMTILVRTGEDGADALIEQLTAAQSLSDRRVYFDCLVKLNAGVPALIHMLGDARWYVARNAADLLGEMQAPEAEAPLADLLRNDDDRVRRAATTALAKLGTPRAMQALHDALRDTSPQVRMQAAAGLASRKGLKSANTLARALDSETDVEVQLTILAALGRVATADAVHKLAKAAEPEGRLFRKKSAAFRIAAIQALGEARTPAALAALESLREDKDKEVRDTVFRVILAAARQG